jgi:undecaprenyl-diphosphatase
VSYLLNAALKGVVEGFTEFLPISSTGHLILVDKWLPLTADPAAAEKLDNMFDLVIQFPAILAIVILFRKRLWDALGAARIRPEARRFWLGLALAFVPIGIAGLMLHREAEALRKPAVVAVALILGGVILAFFERLAMQPAVAKAESVPLATALSIGVCQCLALVPGVSRSGASIVSGRLMGLNRTAAAEFSFFLAIPTMGAACAYKLLKDYQDLDWHAHGAVLLLLAGSLTSFLTAWAVVALFLRLLEKRYGLSAWGWYRILLGLLVLATV